MIGRVFWDDAVRSLAAGDPVPTDDVPIGAVLDQLRDRDLVHQRERSSYDNRREFLFKHALLRDVVYESMLRRHRRHYHELAAEWFADLAARSERDGRVRRHDRRPLRQRDQRRIGGPLVPGRRAPGGLGARPRGRPPAADGRGRPRTDVAAHAARRPAARTGNGARPHRRPPRPAGRPRCAGHARADPRRARPGTAGAGDDQPLPVAVPPQRLRRPARARRAGDRAGRGARPRRPGDGGPAVVGQGAHVGGQARRGTRGARRRRWRRGGGRTAAA